MVPGRQAARTALHRNSVPVAIAVRARLGDVRGIKLHVVRNEQIEMAVAVVIEKGAASAVAGRFCPETCRLGHISERSVAIVAIELVLSEVGAEQVFEPIIVVIADANTRCPTYVTKSSLLGYIGEGSVSIIFVETITGSGRCSSHACAAEQENIHPSVVVIIKKGAATSDCFQNVVIAVGVSINCRMG